MVLVAISKALCYSGVHVQCTNRWPVSQWVKLATNSHNVFYPLSTPFFMPSSKMVSTSIIHNIFIAALQVAT